VGLQPTFYLAIVQAGITGRSSPREHRAIGSALALISRKLSAKGSADWFSSRIRGSRHAMAVDLEAIRSAAARVAASHGLDVVDVELSGPTKGRVLRVFLEKNAAGRERLRSELAAGGEGLPEGLVEGSLNIEQLSGVTHEDCAEFSRDFGVLLDVEDLVPGAQYTLEASSPGLDRKLSRRDDFRRFSGCLAKVQTFEPVAGNRHWQGRLMANEGAGMIALDLDAAKSAAADKGRKIGQRTVEIALTNIEKARLVPEI
jgi:ribosome maturation factor RimP